MNALESIRNALVNHQLSEKLEFLRSIIGINASIVIAVVGLVFLLYQIDRYSKFKRIKYSHMLVYATLSVFTGLVLPVAYIHSSGSPTENNLYIASATSPFLMFLMSAAYMAMTLRMMSTTRIIRKFKYTEKLSVRIEKAKIGFLNRWFSLLAKTVKRNKKRRRKIELDTIGRGRNPLANMADSVCGQHGVVMQEWDATQFSPLFTRDDLLVRMVTTAVEADDWKVLRHVVARYADLLQSTKSFFSEYSEDLESIGAILIRRERNDLYDLLVDELTMTWVKDKKAFDALGDQVGRIFAAILFQYIDKGSDTESTQKAMSRLMAFYFLILTARTHKSPKDWLYSSDACGRYAQKTVLRIAENEQEYNLWLMYEKSAYYAHHGAEVKKVGITVVFMKLIANIGIAGRVYHLHCGATDCSKTIYDHAIDTFEELATYLKDTFNKAESRRFVAAYKESFEKLVGFEVNIQLDKGTYTIDKSKPKTMHAIKMGPTKGTSDSETIDYSKLDKSSLKRLLQSRRASW